MTDSDAAPDRTPPRDPDAFARYARRERARLAGDPHRPQYHLTAPSGWLNDPNGIIHHGGMYHLFYQANPLEARWGAPYWGHAVSTDLVDWRDLPPALRPDDPPADDGGCWSGCAVEAGGVVRLFYTGVRAGVGGAEQATCVATGDADLLNWRKDPRNPIVRPPVGLDITRGDFRDPYVWREADGWYQLVGAAVEGEGSLLLYRSDDLETWTYLHPLIPESARPFMADSGQVWECPNLVPFGDRHLLVFSRWHAHLTSYALAFVGSYRDHRFYPESRGLFDYGQRCLYAPLLRRDARGRVLAWGWLQEARSAEAQLEAGWSGVMSLPRVLSLEDGMLEQRFAPELSALRRACLTEVDGVPSATVELGSAQLELQLRLEQESARQTVLAFGFGPERLTLTLDWQSRVLALHQAAAPVPLQVAPLPEPARTAELHLYLDGSVFELIVGASTALSTRLYPTGAPDRLEIFSREGTAILGYLRVWRLGGIW